MTEEQCDDRVVSIVIPAHNHASYLDGAIGSVLGQTYQPVELLVIDDGSTDDTMSVLRKYDRRFYVESQPNHGQAATISKGWKMARGAILGYLSADDLLKPDAVSVAVQTLARHPEAVAVYCDFDLIDADSRKIRRVNAPEFDYSSLIGDLLCQPGPGAFVRRWAVEQVGPMDSSLRQMVDLEYWLRVGLLGPFVHVPESLACFRIHQASQTFAKADQVKAEEPVLIVRRFFERLPRDSAYRALRRRALSSAHVMSFQLHLRAGRASSAIAHLRRAVTTDPSCLIRVRTLRAATNAVLNRPLYVAYSWLRARIGSAH